jgi:hypothetical protein
LGVRVWHDHEGGRAPGDRWQITELAGGQLHVLAADEAAAIAAVGRWKGQSSRRIIGPTRIERGVSFALSDGTPITEGLRVLYLITDLAT